MTLRPILRIAAVTLALVTGASSAASARLTTTSAASAAPATSVVPALLTAQAAAGDAAGTTTASSPDIAPSFDPAVPGSELTVYVMTMGPGEFVWERFGHNAIWIHDEAQQTDIAYNWGLFSFEQEGFVLRFLRGRMDYWMEGIDAEQMASFYIQSDRSIWVQELNLTPEQRLELREFVEWNALPANRFYRYDYFRDNCSTRVRDALDRVLGGQLRAETEGVLTGTTYRSHSRDAVGGSPLLFTGIMLGTGHPTDRDLSAWEEMFMPLSMMARIREVTITTPSGERVPLVRSERQIHQSLQLSAEPAEAPSTLGYLAIGLLIAAGIVGSVRASIRRKTGRAAFRLLTIAWCTVAGILGTVLVLLWVATDHTAAYANENLFHFNPLVLVLAILLPMAVTPCSRWRRAAYMLGAAVAGISLLGFLLGLLPGFYQENARLVALALPVNLAIGYAVWFLRRGSTEGRAKGALTGGPLNDKNLRPEPA